MELDCAFGKLARRIQIVSRTCGLHCGVLRLTYVRLKVKSVEIRASL